jgi:hypothetical protein
MKTRTVLMTAMLMIVTISVFSQAKSGNKRDWFTPTTLSQAEITQRDADHVIVWLDKTAESKARITILDADGDQVYNRKIETPDTMKITNDISAFPKGKYFIEVFVDGKCAARLNIFR